MEMVKTALGAGATSKSIYYSIAQAGGAIVFHLPVLLLMPFMTNTLGIPAAAAGFAIFLPKIWIILCDPIVGSWSDRVQRRIGSRRGFVLWGGVATSLSLVALFIVPHIDNAIVMAGYMMLTYALVSTAYSIFAVPYLTMASEIAETPHERTLLSSWRMAFGFGGIMLTTLAPAAVEYFGGGRVGYSKMGLVTGAICLVLVLATSFAIRNFKIRRTEFAVDSSIFLQMRQAFRCAPFVVILRSYAVQMAGMSIVQGGFLYFVIYEVGGSLTTFSHMALVLAAASLLSQPVWVRLSRMLGKLPTYRLSIAALAVGEFLLVFPRHGDNGLTYAVAVVIGATSSGFSMMALSMMIDAIVENSEQSGFNRQGVFSGIWSATEKASFAGGSLIVGLIYQLVGFHASKAGFVEQTPLAHAGIRYVCGLVTPALLLLSLWSLSGLKSPPRARAGSKIIPPEAATPQVVL